MSHPTTDWRALARALAINGQAFIDGRYLPAPRGATFDCVSPIDGRVPARVASCDVADVKLKTVLGYIDAGRDKSLHAFDKYTELKTTWIDPS